MSFPCLTILTLLIGFLMSGSAWAHQVPNMTIEADFDSAGGFVLKVNMDPRVILSAQPTALPPVAASWYLDQTPEQLKITLEKAAAYLDKNLKFQFGAATLPLPPPTWQAMDGTTNLEVKTDTTEVHLLATLKGTVPAEQKVFVLDFGAEASVSLILLLKTHAMPEAKVQVLFPGETSRAFELTIKKSVD